MKLKGKESNFAFWLGLGALLWALIGVNVPYWIVMYYKNVTGVEKSFSPWVGVGLLAIELILALAGLFYGIKAYKKGDQSWKVLLGIAFAGIVILFLIMFLIGEFIFPH